MFQIHSVQLKRGRRTRPTKETTTQGRCNQDRRHEKKIPRGDSSLRPRRPNPCRCLPAPCSRLHEQGRHNTISNSTATTHVRERWPVSSPARESCTRDSSGGGIVWPPCYAPESRVQLWSGKIEDQTDVQGPLHLVSSLLWYLTIPFIEYLNEVPRGRNDILSYLCTQGYSSGEALKCPGGCSATAQVVQSSPQFQWGPPALSRPSTSEAPGP